LAKKVLQHQKKVNVSVRYQIHPSDKSDERNKYFLVQYGSPLALALRLLMSGEELARSPSEIVPLI
jgi:hypothetical protein